MRTDHDGLSVAPSAHPARLVTQVYHAVAVLVQPTCHQRVGAVGDVFASDLERAVPLTVVPAVETEVEACSEVES
jgi:hypothetical protein